MRMVVGGTSELRLKWSKRTFWVMVFEIYLKKYLLLLFQYWIYTTLSWYLIFFPLVLCAPAARAMNYSKRKKKKTDKHHESLSFFSCHFSSFLLLSCIFACLARPLPSSINFRPFSSTWSDIDITTNSNRALATKHAEQPAKSEHALKVSRCN